MTPSLASAEKGKPPCAGRCLLATDDFPQRQPRRIRNSLSVQPAARVVAISPRLGDRGDAFPKPRRRRAPFTLTIRNELGGNSVRQGAQSYPGIGSLHVPEHGEPDEQDVAENVRGLADVRS